MPYLTANERKAVLTAEELKDDAEKLADVDVFYKLSAAVTGTS